MKISTLVRAKQQNPVLRNPDTLITHHFVQIFGGKQYLFVEYVNSFGNNTSIHTTDEHITDYFEWTRLMKLRGKGENK